MLDRLETWSEDWQLLFNSGKCKVMHFGKKNTRQEYTMGGHILESSKQEKDIGVLIDHSLKPSAQCTNSAYKANFVLGQLTRGCIWRDPDNLTNLYKVYIRPHLEYAQASWSPWTQADIQPFEQVQIMFARQVSGIGSLPYDERLDRLGLTILKARRERGDTIETYKIITGKVDVQPSTWFSSLEIREGAARTRANSGHLSLARTEAKSVLSKNQFAVSVVPKWNALPDIVKSQETLNNFKNAYDNLQN